MLKAYYTPNIIEAGCDEAGRGCLAGPVVAAAVILPPDFYCKELNDSKQLDEKTRYALREIIFKEATSFGVAEVSPAEIDTNNILNASIKAMHIALEQLSPEPMAIIVDGNRFKPWRYVPYTTIVKGDGLYASIAAASILAKTHRDDLMKSLHSIHPEYNWAKNMGYPTLAHRKAILKFGPTDFHRTTFKVQVSEDS